MEELSFRASRLNNITATEMATLFGLNPYETPSKLLDKKLKPQIISSIHLRRGKLKEPSVLEAFKLDMDLATQRHGEGTVVLKDVRIAATPDAYVLDTFNVVECKSVTSRNLEKWYDAIPSQYHVQVLVQMMVMDSEEGYIGALEEGDPYECEYRFVAWKVARNKRIEELMVQEVARFWDSTETLFRVSSKAKKEMQTFLESSAGLIYPKEIPIKKELSDEEKLSGILSLFK